MKLSTEQKRLLAEERLRRLEHSAVLAAERAPLLQLLSPQMLRDDGTNMERTFQVRLSDGQNDAARGALNSCYFSMCRTDWTATGSACKLVVPNGSGS